MLLKPTKQRFNNFNLYGFDIETYDNNKKFSLACVDDETFYDKRSLIDYFKQDKFHNSYVCATNLGFDFYGIFYGADEEKQFKRLERNSKVLAMSTYIRHNKLYKRYIKNAKKLIFIDTLNYAKISVEDWGKLLNIPKLKYTNIGKKPNTLQEWDDLKRYCQRDANISRKAIQFLFNAFQELGATPKRTIASTSMNLFTNRFLKYEIWRASTDKLIEQFKSYYGANCHAYGRGLIENYNLYDVNSIYPFVMKNEYPNPNTMRVTHKNTNSYIQTFDGVSLVKVYCPYMDYPLLPLKLNKLIFPYGTFTGWYSHIELRKAQELGYVIQKVYRTYYYKENIKPFEDYVDFLYDKRLRYQENKNPLEIVMKLLMNSLYGKFGQKFLGMDDWQYFDMTKEELDKLDYFEVIGNYIRIKKDVEPACFCIPVWACYTTAMARIHLHSYIVDCKPDYTDTDCLFTKKTYPYSNKLGALKLERKIKKGIIVKPKFYMIDDKCIIKGIGKKVTPTDFYRVLRNEALKFNKFMKFKESIRRNFRINEIVEVVKEMSLEDDKRLWSKKFDYNEFQTSRPLEVKNNIVIRNDKKELEYELENETNIIN